VRTPQEAAIELEVLPSDTIGFIKSHIAEREGTCVVNQRLIYNGMNLSDARTLSTYYVRHGAVLLLVPQLKEQSRRLAFAPRGMLMVPGSKEWQPSHPARPYMPVVCSDFSRNFPISLEFESAGDFQAFVSSAQMDPPILEIIPAAGVDPVETQVHLDTEAEMVSLGSTGNIFAPGGQYAARMHFGGRGGEAKVMLVAGSAVQ